MRIIPKPLKVELLEGEFAFSSETSLLDAPSKLIREELFFMDFVNGAKNCVKFVKTDANNDECDYQMEICENITIYYATDEGAFHAAMSLKQLIFEYYDNGISNIPKCRITDKARFGYRGCMMDVSRHFFSVDTVKKMIECMAFAKMNVLHWHLSDNQGFRVQSDKFPKLNRIGSRVACENSENTKFEFYSKAEIADVLAFAKERFVEVVPEIDLPGHTLDMLASYPELGCTKEQFGLCEKFQIDSRILCVGKENTYDFVCELLDEMCELFPSKYFHIGGDEVPKSKWKACPDCQNTISAQGLKNAEELQGYFTNRLINHLKTRDKVAIVWNDAMYSGKLSDSATVQYWNDPLHKTHIKEAADSGRKIVVSKTFKYYLDYNYSMTRLRDSYMFEPTNIGLSEDGKKNVIGVEATLWSEVIHSEARLFDRAFPRLFAVAESGWSQPKKNYKDFEDRLDNMLGIMCAYEFNFKPVDECNPCVILKSASTAAFFAKLNRMSVEDVIKDKNL